MPLYGHELDREKTPLDAGLDMFVDLSMDFIGRAALEQQRTEGLKNKLIGLSCPGRRVPREGCSVVLDGENIGTVVSGTSSPTLGHGIATAYVRSELMDRLDALEKDADNLSVDIRGHLETAHITGLPFYKTQAPRTSVKEPH